ncbi:MAG TPA: lytic transglycosylase domain-containing protein [Bacillota bacterium]|nr:lytic transglycosylase domain-containing protein [Bacillota bacterium]HOL08729.1 lytic transglycosylase domain-containing protein [Bacillota bacterium]HPO96368.1 lytic transglycosylase domain-containing protein [Bacillota bacterium]
MKNKKTTRNNSLVLLLIIFTVIWHKPILRIYFVLDFKEKIIAASKQKQVDPALISAIVFVESRFNPKAQSSKGALGLMQVMPQTGKWVAEKIALPDFTDHNLLNPNLNIDIGIWYFRYLIDHFNQNEALALAAYNAGMGYVERWIQSKLWDGNLVQLEKIPFPETRKYLFRIYFLKKVYRYLYPELTLMKY